MIRILALTKRQYTNKDLLDDRFGRLREIPLELGHKGFDVSGLCLSYDAKGYESVQDGPVSWESLDSTRLLIPGLGRFILRAVQQAKEVDVIWACSDSFYGVIAYFIGKVCNVPVVFDLYDNFEYFLAAKLPPMKKLYRRAIKGCAAITCASRPLAELVKSYGRSTGVYVLENAIRKDIFKPLSKTECRNRLGLPPDAHIIGTAGAIYENRGIALLFTAFGKLAKTNPSLHLAFAGPRPSGFRIPPNPRIHDLGVLKYEDVPVFINALDVAAICNAANAFGKYCFPQKAREIMACDVPLVAARVGTMPEILSGYPEWLYTPNDRDEFAKVLKNRLSDRRTDYTDVISWPEAASVLEQAILDVLQTES